MRARIAVALLLTLLADAALAARRHSVRVPTPPPLDEETLRGLTLEHGNIDVEPGTKRRLRFWIMRCCVYFLPVEANAKFFMDSTTYVSVDRDTGELTIAPDAPGGTSYRVYADIEGGRRIIAADVSVDDAVSNPLRGRWRQRAEIPCDGGPDRVPVVPIAELIFRGDRTFSVTWRPFEVYKDYWGFYSFNKPPGRVTLGIRHGNHVPAGFRGDGGFTIVGEGQQRVLRITGVSFGRESHSTAEETCGAVFER